MVTGNAKATTRDAGPPRLTPANVVHGGGGSNSDEDWCGR